MTNTGPSAFLQELCVKFDRLFSFDHSDARQAKTDYDEAFHGAVHALKDLRQFAVTISPEWHDKELKQARETIQRLNRRVQSAESGLAEKINANAGRSFGRSLANAAAWMYNVKLEDIERLLTKDFESIDGLRNDIRAILDRNYYFEGKPSDDSARL